MKSRLDKELEQDIAFLNETMSQIVRARVIEVANLESAEQAFSRVSESDVAAMPPAGQAAFRFVKDHLPELRKMHDWRPLVGSDVAGSLQSIVTGEFTKKKARALEKTYDELSEIRENMLVAVILLTQPRIQSPNELLTILIELFTDDAEGATYRKYLVDLRKLVTDLGAVTDEHRYWQDVASGANMLSFMVVVFEVLLKWIDHGLDEWDAAQSSDRPVKPEVFLKLGELTAFLQRNDVWIQIAGLLLLGAQLVRR
jgi:hypothetical protein